ncbi:acyltransferase [Pedobacter sp. MC2016-24]|uniref:acyltransferase family protein n=1 Tax=Pedobacter sp. MC2016-24 TaxID=2780090 RepID=UPI001D16AB0A|nr:acyltransferase [Pedobacter sp. MC2016-24]
MVSNLTKDINRRIDILKVFSIISVIMAHSRSVDYGFLSIITERLGTIGVVCFLFIAGYFFNPDKYGFKNFFYNKVTTILVPWVFTGTVVYLVINRFELGTWLNWLIGNGSYLYYLTTLMICYLIMFKIKNNKLKLGLLILTVTSLILTSFGYLDQISNRFFGISQVYNYLNCFNWLGFFILGMISRGKMESINAKLAEHKYLFFLLFILFLGLGLLIEPEKGGYFSKLAIPCEILGAICFWNLSALSFFDNKYIYSISAFTFSIYLIHFLVFPFRRLLIHNQFVEFINPIIYLCLASVLIFIGLQIAFKLKLDKAYSLLMGIRSKRDLPSQL